MTAPIGKVFVSHSSADKSFVDRLVADLAIREIPVWYDKFDIQIGDSVPGTINSALTTSKYFLIVLSKSSAGSRWVQEELNAALMQQVMSGGTFILPILIEDCEVPSGMRLEFERGAISGNMKLSFQAARSIG